MNNWIRNSILGIFLLTFSTAYAVHTIKSPTSGAPVFSQSMTVNQFLSIDPDQIRKSNGIKQAWAKRWVVRHAQHRLQKKIDNGKLSRESTLNQAFAKGNNPNNRGKWSLILAGAGFLFLFLGPLAYLTLPLAVAGLVLGIIGLQKDRDRTMAIIGIVLGGLTLLIFLLALLIVFTFLGLF
jgi:hypothetical protein